jgi:toxin ParE1/3/4
MRYKVEVESIAWDDLQSAIDYYATFSKTTSLRFHDRAIQTISELAEYANYQIRYEQIRIRMIKGFPYSIHYEVFDLEKIILVYGIRFQKMDESNTRVFEPAAEYVANPG